MTVRTRRLGCAALATVAALCCALVAACGSETADPTVQGPAVTWVVAADLEEIPLPAGSRPYAPAAIDGAVIAQTFQVIGTTPDRVLAFFDQALPREGWTAAAPLHREPSDRRSDWLSSDRRLEVSAIRAPGSGRTAVQFSLILRPG